MSPTREETISGLRKLVDLLEQNPDLPLPYETTNAYLGLFPRDLETYQLIIGLLGRPSKAELNMPTNRRHYYTMRVTFEAIPIIIYVAAEHVADQQSARRWTLRPEFAPAETMAEVA